MSRGPERSRSFLVIIDQHRECREELRRLGLTQESLALC